MEVGDLHRMFPASGGKDKVEADEHVGHNQILWQKQSLTREGEQENDNKYQ